MKSSIEEFNESWDAALPSDNYAILQLSARKWAVLKDSTRVGKSILHQQVRGPRAYEQVATFPNSWLAQEDIRTRVISDFAERLKKEGQPLLETLTDAQLNVLPLGPISDAGLIEYMCKRIGETVATLAKERYGKV